MRSPELLPLEKLVAEGQRMLAICNACRYCKGYCPVFPALQRRLEFGENELHYLANLCHNCGACFHACQYAPPHEFQLNFPRLLAQVRVETYAKYAWPAFLGRLFRGHATAVSLIGIVGVLLALLLASRLVGETLYAPHPDASGAFYALVPHAVMAWTFGVAGAFVLGALAIGFLRFWRASGEAFDGLVQPAALAGAVRDALTLRHLDGGGDGCTAPTGKASFARRRLHHLTFYGFLLCFAATSVATLYHYAFGWKAPYPFFSLPVLLGTAGGIGLLVGPVGLLWIRGRRDPELSDPRQSGMDGAFLVLLFLTSLSGLALLAWRESAAMGTLLCVHLAVVLVLFVTLPYGKFVHGIYRLAALLRHHLERRRPVAEFRAE